MADVFSSEALIRNCCAGAAGISSCIRNRQGSRQTALSTPARHPKTRPAKPPKSPSRWNSKRPRETYWGSSLANLEFQAASHTAFDGVQVGELSDGDVFQSDSQRFEQRDIAGMAPPS